jgi:hypothetical protein
MKRDHDRDDIRPRECDGRCHLLQFRRALTYVAHTGRYLCSPCLTGKNS